MANISNDGTLPAVLSMKKALGLALLAIIFPFIATGGWLFWGTTCAHCRKAWLFSWPLMPGGVIELFVFRRMPAQIVASTVAIILTLTLIAVTAAFVRRGRAWLLSTLISVFLLGCYLALAACALIRA